MLNVLGLDASIYASLGCSFHPMQIVDSLKVGRFPPTTKKHKQIIKLTVVVKLGITPNLMAIQNFPPNVPSVFFRLAFLGGVTRSGWCLHMQTPHPDRRA